MNRLVRVLSLGLPTLVFSVSYQAFASTPNSEMHPKSTTSMVLVQPQNTTQTASISGTDPRPKQSVVVASISGTDPRPKQSVVVIG
ncbi:MAG TPA: hypothetical protein VHB45_13725 [Alloacidobacterium sp.]|nr:hypothetical protein [Alloacidobacterium sp.]